MSYHDDIDRYRERHDLWMQGRMHTLRGLCQGASERDLFMRALADWRHQERVGASVLHAGAGPTQSQDSNQTPARSSPERSGGCQ